MKIADRDGVHVGDGANARVEPHPLRREPVEVRRAHVGRAVAAAVVPGVVVGDEQDDVRGRARAGLPPAFGSSKPTNGASKQPERDKK